MKKTLVALITLALIFGFTSSAFADLTMGIFPRRPAALTMKMFTPLAKALEAELGEPVKIVALPNFQAFFGGVMKQQFDIVHYNQYHYLQSKAKGYEAIATNVEFGSPKISGPIVVRKDSGINSLADLKGKNIIFGGGPKAMVAYIMNLHQLNQAGLAPSDYKASYAKNPPAAIIPVFNKLVDAAGVGNSTLKMGVVKDKINTDDLKILSSSEEIVQLVWAAKSSLGADKIAKIQNLMTNLNSTNPEIVKGMGMNDLVKVSEADFDNVKKVIKDSLGETY